MARSTGNKKQSIDLPGAVMTSGPSAAANCEQSRPSRAPLHNELSREIAPSTSVGVADITWQGSNLSSSSSSASSSSGDSDSDNDNNSSSSSSSSDSSSDNSGDEAAKNGPEDDAASKVDEYFRQKFKDKLTVAFKAELPTIESDLTDIQPIFIRIPNFMPVELDAYEEHTYKNALSQDDLKDNESREAFITKLKTTVRWRESQDKSTGAIYKESNARFVYWSDGSQTFHVGGEAFDVIHHPVSGSQNQLYVCLGNYYRRQCPIKEKLTLRPKLESNFGLSHVQGLRKRAFYKPMSNCVKILTDLTTNPVLDRERKAKEEWAQTRKEKSQQRREQQNQRKPSVKPMRHCTADDTEADASIQQPYNTNPDDSNGGLRTNRNTDIEQNKYGEGSDVDSSDNDLENLSDDS